MNKVKEIHSLTFRSAVAAKQKKRKRKRLYIKKSEEN